MREIVAGIFGGLVFFGIVVGIVTVGAWAGLATEDTGPGTVQQAAVGRLDESVAVGHLDESVIVAAEGSSEHGFDLIYSNGQVRHTLTESEAVSLCYGYDGQIEQARCEGETSAEYWWMTELVAALDGEG